VAGSENEEGSAASETAATGQAIGGAQTTEERTENLDRKLDTSLNEFDGILLKEQEILDERREAAGEPSMGGGYGATGEEPPGSEVSDEREEGEEVAEGGLSGGSPDVAEGEDSESAPGDTMGGDPVTMDSDRVPPDVGDGSDDDIVAGQLREAAMKEDDPELRAKLWDEYRAYKKGVKDD
jgi:hypothetical protein